MARNPKPLRRMARRELRLARRFWERLSGADPDFWERPLEQPLSPVDERRLEAACAELYGQLAACA